MVQSDGKVNLLLVPMGCGGLIFHFPTRFTSVTSCCSSKERWGSIPEEEPQDKRSNENRAINKREKVFITVIDLIKNTNSSGIAC